MKPADIDLLRALYVESRQELYTYALSFTGHREAAEDTLHGVFASLLRREKLPDDLRPYVFRAVRNSAHDAWRRARVRTTSIFDAVAGENPPPGSLTSDEIAPLLERLSPDERETIVLKIYAGLTFQEIANLRQTPLPTVASWYRRGLALLKSMLNTERP